MDTLNYNLGHSFHVVLDINKDVDLECHVLCFQGEFFVSMEGVFIHLIYILKHVLEFLDKFVEKMLVHPMLHFHQESLHTLRLDRIRSQLVINVLSILTSESHRLPQLISSSLPWDDQFKVICMPKSDPVEMIEVLFLGNEHTIDENFGLWVRMNRYFAFLVVNGTMPWHDTKYIQLNMVLISILCTNFSLSIFQIVDQHS